MSSGRSELLRAGEQVVLKHGFHGAGVVAIAEAAGMSKALFFHHFKSKDEFGVELARLVVENEIAQVKSIFSATNFDAAQRLNLLWNAAVGRMMAGGFRLDSMVLRLGTEAAAISNEMREILGRGMGQIRRLFEEVVREGQRQGVITRDYAAEEAAILIQDRWNGATLRAALEGNVTALEAAAKALRRELGIRGTGAGLPRA